MNIEVTAVIWFPEAHSSISYSKKRTGYFECESCPEFQNNTQYPDEKIGRTRMTPRIDFVTPEEFEFSKSIMKENNIPFMMSCGCFQWLYLAY